MSGGGSYTNVNAAMEMIQYPRKRSALKNLRELTRDDCEFFEAADMAIQTSFDKGCLQNFSDQNQVPTSATEEELNSARPTVTPGKA